MTLGRVPAVHTRTPSVSDPAPIRTPSNFPAVRACVSTGSLGSRVCPTGEALAHLGHGVCRKRTLPLSLHDGSSCEDHTNYRLTRGAGAPVPCRGARPRSGKGPHAVHAFGLADGRWAAAELDQVHRPDC